MSWPAHFVLLEGGRDRFVGTRLQKHVEWVRLYFLQHDVASALGGTEGMAGQGKGRCWHNEPIRAPTRLVHEEATFQMVFYQPNYNADIPFLLFFWQLKPLGRLSAPQFLQGFVAHASERQGVNSFCSSGLWEFQELRIGG